MSIARKLKESIRGALHHRFMPPQLLHAARYVKRLSGLGGGIAFPERAVQVTDRVPSVAVLVLSPHPDDEVIGMGGTLGLHIDNGSEVTVLYVTDGGGLGGSREQTIATRRKEAEAVGRDTGIRQVFWDIEDMQLTNDEATVAQMTALLGERKPKLVYLPSYFDNHFDHFAANAVLADALRRLPDLNPVILGYEVWDTTPFPNYMVDVSKHMANKREWMRRYETPMKSTDFIRLFENRGSVHFALHVDSNLERARTGYAEAFVRLDRNAYLRLYTEYLEMLVEHGSPIASHVNTDMRNAGPTLLTDRVSGYHLGDNRS